MLNPKVASEVIFRYLYTDSIFFSDFSFEMGQRKHNLSFEICTAFLSRYTGIQERGDEDCDKQGI